MKSTPPPIAVFLMYHSKLQLQEKNDNFSDLFAVGSNLFLTDNILLNQATSEFELRGRVTSYSGEFRGDFI